MKTMSAMPIHYKNELDSWIGFICGVGGFGFVNVQFTWRDELLRIVIAATTAFVAGTMGVAGKYFFIWMWKSILLKLKPKK